MRDSLVFDDRVRLVLRSGIEPAWFMADRAWEFSKLPTFHSGLSLRWRYRGMVAGRYLADLSLSGSANRRRASH